MKIPELNNRYFSSISPSARSLILMKGCTNIPYARQKAKWIKYPEEFNPDFSVLDIVFYLRTMYFENRHWSIDHLLEDLEQKNILEIGFLLTNWVIFATPQKYNQPGGLRSLIIGNKSLNVEKILAKEYICFYSCRAVQRIQILFRYQRKG
jgi:hypothetical protein